MPIIFSSQKRFLLICFTIASMLFIGHSLNKTLFPFLTESPYQFILRIGNEHNHLGDLAGLAFISLFLNSFHLFFSMLTLLFIFVVMAISFSKSAFLGILVVTCILAIQKKGKYLFGFICILLVSLTIIAIYTKELATVPLIHSSQEIMTQTLHLNPKSLLSVRDSYYPQVVRAWKSAPLEQLLFGYGSGNYIYPSIKTGTTLELTPTETHNVFLSLFVENGVLSFFWFFIFCLLIVYWGIRIGNPSVYFFIYLFANFQTDFTYAIPFFMVLFFFFAGQSLHQKNEHTNILSPFFLIALVCAGGIIIILGFSYISIQRNKKNLDNKLATAIVKQDARIIQNVIEELEHITPYEEGELVKWSSAQETIGNNEDAIRLLEKLSVYSPRWYLLYLPHQLDLQKKIKIDLKSYLTRRKKDFAQFPFSKEEKKQLNDVCNDYAEMQCVK